MKSFLDFVNSTEPEKDRFLLSTAYESGGTQQEIAERQPAALQQSVRRSVMALLTGKGAKKVKQQVVDELAFGTQSRTTWAIKNGQIVRETKPDAGPLREACYYGLALTASPEWKNKINFCHYGPCKKFFLKFERRRKYCSTEHTLMQDALRVSGRVRKHRANKKKESCRWCGRETARPSGFCSTRHERQAASSPVFVERVKRP